MKLYDISVVTYTEHGAVVTAESLVLVPAASAETARALSVWRALA